MSNLHKRTRLGGSGGMLPHECSEIASEAILGQRQSFNSYLARGVLYPICYARVPRWSPMNKLAYPGTIAAIMQTRLDSGDSQ